MECMECWSNGVMEYCIVKAQKPFLVPLRPSLQFSNTPWSRPLDQTWLARAGFYDFGSPSIATTALYSRQLALSEA